MFKNAVTLFTVKTFDIRVDPSWLIIAALLTWSLSEHYFPGTLPEQSGALYLTMAVVAVLGLFASLVLHELAHLVVARRLGVRVRGITLFVFGGVAELEDDPTSPRDEIWIALAGPVMSFCLATGFWTLAQRAALRAAHPAIADILSYLALANLALTLFNLLPAFPLDAGRVLRACLWQRSGDFLAATRTAARSGAVVAFALMALGVLVLFQGVVVAGLWYVMIGWFVLIAARASYTVHLANAVFAGKSVASVMTADPVTVSPDMTLAGFVNQIMLGHGVSFVPVTDGPVLLGHVDRSIVAGIDRENWANTQVGDVFVGLDDSTVVDPDLPVRDLLARIAATGQRKFLVVSGHRLVGLITLSDLTRCLDLSERA